MSTWREFFQKHKFTTKQRGSASSEWLRTIRSDSKSMEVWHQEKQEREAFWKELKNKESLESYVEDITELVVKDKVAVATKHTADVAAHLESKTVSSRVATRVGIAQRGATRALAAPARKPKVKAKRTSQAAAPQLQEPWKALMEVALALNNDRDVDIPEDRDISHLSSTRQQLYRLALDNLRTYKHDKRQIIAKKDASVALSCTINLSSDCLHDYFDDEFLARAADAYHLQTPKNRTAAVLDPFLKLLAGRDAQFTLEETRIRKGRYQEQQRAGEAVPDHWEAILDIMEHVCRLVLRPSFDGHASEADVVAEWKSVFHILLMNSQVYMRSGECVSTCSKDVKAMLDEEYDEFGAFGRKVDLIFRANGLELANLEFKVAEATDTDIDIQHRKNIRLNRAIMEGQQDACGIKSTLLFLDFQGWHGSLFALYPFEDVFVCKYLGPVALPRTKSGLQKFLKGGTLETLFTFTEHLVKAAELLQESREEKDDLASRKRHMAIFTRQTTPPQKERRISGNVFLTPSKRK
ncbi:hypothetical protein BGZ72_001567 [Mortierella alpina]|nr:hypothetical protein BGZ72_001567 [Mortierella alpina]